MVVAKYFIPVSLIIANPHIKGCSAMIFVVKWLLYSLQLRRNLHYVWGGTSWQQTSWTFRWGVCPVYFRYCPKWVFRCVPIVLRSHCTNILFLLFLQIYQIVFLKKDLFNLLDCNLCPAYFLRPQYLAKCLVFIRYLINVDWIKFLKVLLFANFHKTFPFDRWRSCGKKRFHFLLKQ